MTKATSKHSVGVLFAVAAGQFATPFMLSGVGVVLPVIGMDFHASGVELSLIESVFLGVTAMCLLGFGRAADLMGRNWIFMTGLGIFALSTATLGFSSSIETLIAIRAVQALGGAMQISTGLAILINAYPREQHGKVMGVVLAFAYLGISVGPYVGGSIAEAFGWRALFFISAIPCLIALIAAAYALRWDFHRASGVFDYVGTATNMACVCLFIFGGINADNVYGLVALGGFVVCFFLFLRLEARTDAPLLDLGMFTRSLDFSSGNLLQLITYASTFGLTFLMSLYLQLGRGMTPAEAGLILVLQPLTQSVLMPLCGRLADRISPDLMVSFGMLLWTAGLGWASTFDAATPVEFIYAMLVLTGLGLSLFVPSNMKRIMGAVAPDQYGVATAVTGQIRVVGMTISMVAVSVAITFIVGDQVLDARVFSAFNEVMEVVLRLAGLFGLLGLLLALGMTWRNKRNA